MKLSIILVGLTLYACIIATVYAHDKGHHEEHHRHHEHHRHDEHHHRHRQSTQGRPLHSKTFVGYRYPSSPLREEKADVETPGPRMPIGRPRGPIHPSSPAVTFQTLGVNDENVFSVSAAAEGCAGTNITFQRSSVYGGGGNPPDPSGAKAGNVVFASANTYVSVSIDNGVTFHTLDATVFSGPGDPATSGPLCCDQVVHYIPKIDRFVWLMQYWSNNNTANKLRIISFHPRDVATNGINSWIYLDLFSTQFTGVPSGLDYPDMTIGDNSLYVSATASGVGLIVIRVPVAALDVVGPLTMWYTDPARGDVAYFSHLSQNAGDTVFWGGHSILGTTMRIFRWPESGTNYFWSDIRINDWPSNGTNFISPCPGDSGTNWVFGAQFHDIIGVTRRSVNEVWFSWPAPSGGGFPNLHVQVVQIDQSRWPTLTLMKQWQIWNPDFAFGYPSLYTNNACGDVGVAVAFGGGPYFPASAVGVADSSGILASTVWSPEFSTVCSDRWGDYLTVRQGDGAQYAAFTYAQSSNGGGIERHARYVQFGRTF